MMLNQAFNIFDDNLSEIRRDLLALSTEIIRSNSPYKELNIDKPITKKEIQEHLNFLIIEQRVKPIFKTIRRIDSYRKYKNNPNSTGGVTDVDIQNAREIGKEWFIEQANLSTRRPYKGICPFHNDSTPSLSLMKTKKGNKLYLKCFVCNEAWDSIKFIMRNNDLNFIEAVKYICSI